MNRSFDIIQNIRQWFVPDDEKEEASRLKVPGICHLMPLRWSYEAIIISQAENNPASTLTNYIEDEIQKFSKIPLDQELTEAQHERLYQFKQALAVIHGIKDVSPGHVSRQLKSIRAALEKGTFDPEPYYEVPETKSETKEKTYSVGDLYLNSKVQDLFVRAEVEREDYRKKANPPNIFFGAERQFRLPRSSETPLISFTVKTLHLNLFAMIMFVVVAFFSLRASLKRQLQKV